MAKRRVAKRPPTVARRKAQSKAARRSGARGASRLAKPLERIIRAVKVISASGDAAFAALEEARQKAALQAEQRIVRSLLDERVLHDLMELLTVVAKADPHDEIGRYRHVPEAVRAWFVEHMNLEQIQMPGRVREIPASRVDEFVWTSERPRSATGLLRVQITSPGWKWRGKLVAQTEARLADDDVTAAAVTPEATAVEDSQ